MHGHLDLWIKKVFLERLSDFVLIMAIIDNIKLLKISNLWGWHCGIVDKAAAWNPGILYRSQFVFPLLYFQYNNLLMVWKKWQKMVQRLGSLPPKEETQTWGFSLAHPCHLYPSRVDNQHIRVTAVKNLRVYLKNNTKQKNRANKKNFIFENWVNFK